VEAYIEGLGCGAALAAALPLTLQVLASAVGERSIRLAYERSLPLLLWNDILGLLKVSHGDERERERGGLGKQGQGFRFMPRHKGE
jgi:hypothetical protein